MGLFNRKPKMNIEDFCRQFYDSVIFCVKTDGEGGASTLWESAFNSVTKPDPSLAGTDRDLFRREITALYMELFGLVWTHRFWGNPEKFLWRQLTFTKNYLEQNGHQNIWDIMYVYNQEIIKPVAIYLNCPVRSERYRRARVVSIDHMKLQLYKLWSDQGRDKDCAAHILNRMWSEGAWKEGFILASFCATLVERLVGYDNPQSEAFLTSLMEALTGFCFVAKRAIKSVKVY